MLYQTLTTFEMVDHLTSDEFANWSSQGAEALIEYLEELSDDIGENIEFNRIDLRCEYSEYKNLEELKEEYSHSDLDEIMSNVVAMGKSFVIVRQF